ncbi:MAG TPA: zinc ribbon domain-containing protein [Massilibacterium sp.]|nr:zinc ribbon domain-containing protein [Massilibacterium sp.]
MANTTEEKDGLVTFKENLKQTTSIHTLQEQIQNYHLEKTKLLVELGSKAYGAYKKGNTLDQSEVENLAEQLIGFDRMIFLSGQRIEEIETKGQPLRCECGAVVSPDDRFCGECGKPLEMNQPKETIVCKQCQVSVLAEHHYCPCCGFVLEK